MPPFGLLANHPLIDFDGTLLIQFGLFLLMYGVLKRWVVTPYLQMKAQRTSQIEGAQEEAVTLRKRAAGLNHACEQQLALIHRHIQQEKQTWLHEQQTQDQERAKQVQNELQTAWALAQDKVKQQRTEAETTLSRQIPLVAQALVQKLVGREMST